MLHKLHAVYAVSNAEHAVREFWKRQGARSRDNFTITATSGDSDTFYQVGRQYVIGYNYGLLMLTL